MKKIFLIAFVLLGLVFVSQAQTKHTVGEKFGGGIVFYVDATGEHGLIAETIDQGSAIWMYVPNIVTNGRYSTEGKEFKDWRVPTKDELDKLYSNRYTVGGFTTLYYWSSTEAEKDYQAWCQYFATGKQYKVTKNSNDLFIRTVRTF